MKKSIIVFIVILLATLIIPAAALIPEKPSKSDKKDELVTIFNTGDYKTVQYFE